MLKFRWTFDSFNFLIKHDYSVIRSSSRKILRFNFSNLFYTKCGIQFVRSSIQNAINISTKFEQKLAHLLSSIFANLLFQIQLVIVANRRVTNTDSLIFAFHVFLPTHTHTFTFRRLKLPGNVTSIKMEYSWRGRILSVVEKLKICKGNRKPEKIVGKPNEVTERAKEFFSFISRRMSLQWNYATMEFLRSMLES